jgi:hypothetical protein
MQNGPLHDRASILDHTIRIGPVYMQSAKYGPASVRFGGMTSGETLLNPRKLARVIIGLACRPLHKRDPRHAQRTIELARNKRPDHTYLALPGLLDAGLRRSCPADSRFGSKIFGTQQCDLKRVITCYHPGRKLSSVFGWMPRRMDPIRLHSGWSGSRDLAYLHLVQASPIGLGGTASVQL